MLTASQKRIVRNTGMLYMRMLLVMAVTLYTSRVVLAVLGIEDFGIYHVVVGFVALLGFMHGAMTSATQRYFAFDLGESGGKDLNRIFNTSLLIHAMLALLIGLVAETVGYWFVSTQLTIPDERMAAALWAYHLAIVSFAISVITVPFAAMLMANERMGVFALIGMLDVIMKLAAVFLLQYLQSDKLIAYAGLLLLVSLTTLFLYVVINKLLFQQIKLRLQWHKQQFRSMLSYTAWNAWGNLAAAVSGQGTNILLNIFFGPAVNAGKSISAQANGALTNFVVNVQAAINPQIVKLYASGEQAQMHALVMNAAKYNFFLLFTLALPVLFYTESILSLWLVEVPPFAVLFLQLTIAASLIDTFSGPLMTAAQATGYIRLYQSVVGGVLLFNLPVSFLFLHWGYPPESVLITSVGLSVVALVARLLIISPLIELPKTVFLSKVLGRAVTVALTAGTGAYLLVPSSTGSLINLIQGAALLGVISLVAVWLLGLSSIEKKQIIYLMKNIGARFA